MALREVLSRLYGIKTDMVVNPLNPIVAAGVVTQLLQPNPNRLSWSLTNLGGVAMYVAFTPDPAAANGIYVAQNGGDIILLYNEDFELVTYPLFATAAFACPVYTVEVFAA